MAASLVADYGTDSESDGDNESEHNNVDIRIESSGNDALEKRNFFTAAADEDSDSDTDLTDKKDVTSRETNAVRLPNPLASGSSAIPSKLPPPGFTAQRSDNNTKSNNSVFVNPFQKAEEAKLSVLEQHVKMTSTHPPVEGGKKGICKNFKQGKCRFGRKCKFMHSSDVVGVPVSDEGSHEGQKTVPNHNYYGGNSYHGQIEIEEEDDDSYMGQAKRKFRAGINDTLKPPKKALVALDSQRKKERPWTKE